MASHLTIISSTAGGGVNSRSFGNPRETVAQADAPSPFAALLGGEDAVAAGAGVRAGARQDETGLAGLFRLGLEPASAEAGQDDADNAEAIAAALDLARPDAAPVDPAPVLDLVEALSALRASLERDEKLDPDLLERVDAALAGLAEALGLDLEALPVPEDIAALLDATATGTLNPLLAPLAPVLTGAEAAMTTDGAEAARDRLKALGDKLAALLAALDDGAIDPETLAAIGLKPGAPPAAEIEAALARFAAALPTDAPLPDEPLLATPSLKTSEPALTGKQAENAAPSDAAAEPAKSGERRDAREDGRPEAPPRDHRPALAEAPADNAAAAPARQDAATLRLEAVAPGRVVQSGYQTSQQQLNLPQLAFELARQVQDGNTRFQIRLDPPELGKIDVRLDIDKAGQVHARLTVEKSETLDLMQRDQRALERALQQAGLDSGKTSLEFSLKQNPFAGQQDRQDGGGDTAFAGKSLADGEAEEAPPMVNLYRGSLQASGVNIIA